MQQSKHRSDNFARLKAADPSPVFAAKSLLYPVGAVVSLLVCLVLWDEPLYGPNFLVAVLGFISVSSVCGLAHIQRIPADPHHLGSLRRIVQSWVLVLTFLWALLHLSRQSRQFNMEMYAAWAVLTPPLLWLGEVITIHFLSATRSPQRARRAVIVGMTDLGLKLERYLHHENWMGTKFLGYFEDRTPDRLPTNSAEHILGRPADLSEFIAKDDVSVVYVALPMSRTRRIADILDALKDSTVSIYFIPDVLTFDLIQARFDMVGSMPVVAVRESPFYGGRAIAKRFSDILMSMAMLITATPVMAVIAIAIRLTSPGPILFSQRRYGLDGQEIVIHKFRSMSVMEDGSTSYTQVTRNDARVTPLGAFLRRTSLDELPQLFDVFLGRLSIVGPRPHAIAVNEQYRKLIPSYMVRHKVKPGITGWAQINGFRGGDDLESMTKRIEFDLDYLRNWSLALDLSIMVRTAATVWNDTKAY